MRILVSGGAGFIGSNLVKRLLSKGHEVIVLDNLLRGNKLDKDTLKKIKFILGDVRDFAIVSEAMKNCDAVYHFAAILGVDIVADHPIETMDVEIIGTRNMLEAAAANKIKYFLYASTSGIYSHSAIVKSALSEDVLVDPRTSYAMAKRYNEIYLAAHHKERGLNVISLRFFNVYGHNQDNRMVVPRFFEQALKDEDITVFGTGNQTRDFTYIEDTIDACVSLLGVSGAHIINIANEKEWNITTLAEKIIEITKSKSKIKYKEFSSKRYDYEVERRVGSSAKLKELVNYKPATELVDGLQKIYEINYL